MLHAPANGLGLKFSVNHQLKWFEQSQRSEKKICCSIPLFMKATIPGTHGMSCIIILDPSFTFLIQLLLGKDDHNIFVCFVFTLKNKLCSVLFPQ
jgi:hypothetical protein